MTRPKRARADELLVRAELAGSIEAARALVMTGRVMASIDGKERRVEKAGELLPSGALFRLTGEVRRFVSRGGEKLAAALDAFGIDPSGRTCADIGLSTGGFTHCLLERGAQRVHGVDVGYGDVAWNLRTDPRVVLWERTNARHLTERHFGERVSLVVIDVSFISLEVVLPAVLAQLEDAADVVALVKPQFEAPRSSVVAGVVPDPAARRAAVDRVRASAEAIGLRVEGEVESPLLGADGNVELLLHLARRSSKILRVTLGVLEAGTPAVYRIEPYPDGLSVVATGTLSSEAIAAAVRHALSRPEPRSPEPIPFVRVALGAGEVELEVADDAAQSMRMLSEVRSGAAPLVIEAGPDQDAEMDALLARIGASAGLLPNQLGAALARRAARDEAPGGAPDATGEALAFLDAHRRATQLAGAVRAVDDQMTASVVPDWLWIATGFGGLGVLLTAIVFLYPETRLRLIPALIALSVVGFGLYGWRSFAELRVRGRLQIERAELRARREAAREEARALRARLCQDGADPDALLVRLQEIVVPPGVPAIFAQHGAALSAAGPPEQPDHQQIVLADGAVEHARAVPMVKEKIG